MKSGNRNFLEPSGPLQACNGTDFPFSISSQYMNYEALKVRNSLQPPVTASYTQTFILLSALFSDTFSTCSPRVYRPSFVPKQNH